MRKKLILAPIFVLAITLLWVVSLSTGTEQAVASGSGQTSLTAPPAEGSSDGIWKVPAGSRAVVWDNGMNYINMLSAQVEPTGDLVSEPADDFIFDVDQLVNDVHWIGGYFYGPPDDGDFDWRVTFYNDFGDGTKPGALIATWDFANASVNETLVQAITGGGYYSYTVDLPMTLTFMGGTKYWISIQGLGDRSPQSAWGYHDDPILFHEAVFRSAFFGYPDWTDLSVIFGEPYDMCFQLTYEESCEWNPGDPHKMHFPQLPDELGWDVNATSPLVLAEDWMCSQTGWIKDFHFWGSWKHDNVGQILYFVLSIHSDIPADPPQIPYSRPGITLWEREVIPDGIEPFDPPSMEGWYDPSTGEVIFNDHQHYFRYDVCLDEQFWFHQEQGTIYWLNISAVVADAQATHWGWKSTLDRWNDDAVWAFWGELNWIEMYEPSDPIYNFWEIALDPAGNFMSGWGSDAYDDPTAPGYLEGGWYQYPSGWYNIWFYDHPLDTTAWKDAWGDYFLVQPIEPGVPIFLTLAVNWATDLWSWEFPDMGPPLPGVDEELYIGREIIYEGEIQPGVYTWDWHFPDYNPEWISIDVMGSNFWIDQGNLYHDCRASMNLAFVVTGPDEQPCDCTPGDADGSGAIDISDAVYIIAYIFGGGPAPTPYALCSGDADCNCAVDISDAVFLIAYIFGGGPPPCDCLTWLSACGPPLR